MSLAAQWRNRRSVAIHRHSIHLDSRVRGGGPRTRGYVSNGIAWCGLPTSTRSSTAPATDAGGRSRCALPWLLANTAADSSEPYDISVFYKLQRPSVDAGAESGGVACGSGLSGSVGQETRNAKERGQVRRACRDQAKQYSP